MEKDNMKALCKKCGKVGEFYKCDRGKMCKKCRGRYVWEQSAIRKMKIVEYMGGGCEICGYNKYYGALEMHHEDPSKKEYGMREMRSMAWEKIVKEMEKCILLCANCHREAHAQNLDVMMSPHNEMSDLTQKSIKDRSKKCCLCNKDFLAPLWHKKQKFCSEECRNMDKRKVKERPATEELQHLIETMPITKIAIKYGVGGSTIRKWAGAYGLNAKIYGLGYWQKKYAGKI